MPASRRCRLLNTSVRSPATAQNVKIQSIMIKAPGDGARSRWARRRRRRRRRAPGLRAPGPSGAAGGSSGLSLECVFLPLSSLAQGAAPHR